ncbi:4'-phosphopantetheinyl transferase superfamily protein [Geodermatophilus tzadiensis]|uniref:4'-phosphopantetheinyl transferase superfamily protein n=1 Tax=Geodermatophilus tzadiensis TaxID=1137988 RepID=A0A2T0TUM5_9ACTN|nr:4'-phosphopantetheinyl transferase superfamily protein [Geodermatophilus tzadiensis]PRY49355.1 4'-phosphopantetheinyl transferase superfamily protein [Geodermatophilus tzadiensis]
MPPPVPASSRALPWADVAVRLVDLAADDAELARAEAVLSPAELARARRGTPAVHRRRVLLRAALRTALAAELGTDPARVPLGTTAAGRPELPPATGLDAGCSASGGLGVVAVGRGCRVGVDVERVAPWTADVLDEGWLADAEQRALTALPEGARALAATRAWTQKEAVLKGRGTGLREDPAAVVTEIGRTDGTVAGWAVRDVPVPDGWVASLAVAPHQEVPS